MSQVQGDKVLINSKSDKRERNKCKVWKGCGKGQVSTVQHVPRLLVCHGGHVLNRQGFI